MCVREFTVYKRSKTMLEVNIERKLREAATLKGCLVYKFVSPGMAGVPDRIIIAPGGVVYFIETKRPKGGRLSAIQKYHRDRISRQGGHVRVILNEEQIKQFIAEITGEGVVL